VKVWDVQNGDLLHTLNSTQAPVNGNVHSVGGGEFRSLEIGAETMITGTGKGRVNVWDLETMSLLQTFRVSKSNPVNHIVYNHEENVLLTLSERKIKHWRFVTSSLQLPAI
jgi:WD40 repeat protein